MHQVGSGFLRKKEKKSEYGIDNVNFFRSLPSWEAFCSVSLQIKCVTIPQSYVSLLWLAFHNPTLLHLPHLASTLKLSKHPTPNIQHTFPLVFIIIILKEEMKTKRKQAIVMHSVIWSCVGEGRMEFHKSLSSDYQSQNLTPIITIISMGKLLPIFAIYIYMFSGMYPFH